MPLTLNNFQYTHFLAPSQVEFRSKSGWGEQVIRVSTATREPRIKAWTEKLGTHGVLEIDPMYLSIGEIEVFVRETRTLLNV